MRSRRAALSRHAAVAKAIDYMLKRWDGFARFLDDGRICLTNNAAERALRGIALGRKSWLFAGSDRGGVRAAAMYTLIGTAKLNDVDPQAWLADVLGRIAETPQSRLDELLPWNWEGQSAARSGRIGRDPARRIVSRPPRPQTRPKIPCGLRRMVTIQREPAAIVLLRARGVRRRCYGLPHVPRSDCSTERTGASLVWH